MAEFPTGFAEDTPSLHMNDIARGNAMAFERLGRKGFWVEPGLTRADVPALTEIASQEGTIEFCANDIKTRWTDEATAEKQLAKDGGRGVVRLVDITDNSIIGFGWTGKSSEKERKLLPDCENTFAIRLHERARGKNLATDFSKAIVAVSMGLWKARRIGLETWGSNTNAVRAYLGAGAVLVTTQYDERPTQYEDERSYRRKEDGELYRSDVRLYMQYPWSF